MIDTGVYSISDMMLDRIELIEKRLLQLNTKIDNFEGHEERPEEERKEIEKIRQEVKFGDYVPLDETL